MGGECLLMTGKEISRVLGVLGCQKQATQTQRDNKIYVVWCNAYVHKRETFHYMKQ